MSASPVSARGYDDVFVEVKKHFTRGGIDLDGIYTWSFHVDLTERPSFIFSLPRRVTPIRPLAASASGAAQLCFASVGMAMG